MPDLPRFRCMNIDDCWSDIFWPPSPKVLKFTHFLSFLDWTHVSRHQGGISDDSDINSQNSFSKVWTLALFPCSRGEKTRVTFVLNYLCKIMVYFLPALPRSVLYLLGDLIVAVVECGIFPLGRWMALSKSLRKRVRDP